MEMEDMSNTINQLDLPDIYRTLQSTAATYTFFSNLHGIASRIDAMLDTEQVSIH